MRRATLYLIFSEKQYYNEVFFIIVTMRLRNIACILSCILLLSACSEQDTPAKAPTDTGNAHGVGRGATKTITDLPPPKSSPESSTTSGAISATGTTHRTRPTPEPVGHVGRTIAPPERTPRSTSSASGSTKTKTKTGTSENSPSLQYASGTDTTLSDRQEQEDLMKQY